MIKGVLIDDEKDARFLLRNLIQKKLDTKIEIIGEADDVESGYQLIEKMNPDLVFLDIQMRSGTGFDLLEKIPHPDFEVVFITAHNEHAIKAFKFSAFDYLMKPIKSSELENTVLKLEEKFKATKSDREKQVRILIENYGSKGEIQKLIVNNIEGFKVLEINSIIRLDGDRNYTHIILSDGKKITTTKNLGEYETLLEDHGFFRIHQSTMVSLRHVIGFKKADDGSVEMSDGSVLKVSRSRKQEFIAKFT